MSSPAVQLTNISKRYYLHSNKPTLIENLNPFKKPKEFWALKDVNLKVNQGDRIGIVGHNGAGKTTLLKIIAGITKPTHGQIKTSGRIVSLIELSAGFNPEQSGIENIWLNGLLIGMTKTEIKTKITDIISFADIGEFINQPVYTYSEGMLLRLSISIIINSNASIYLFDENLFVGDAEFTEKLLHKIDQIFDGHKTLLLASHNEYLINRLCKTTLKIEHQDHISSTLTAIQPT